MSEEKITLAHVAQMYEASGPAAARDLLQAGIIQGAVNQIHADVEDSVEKLVQKWCSGPAGGAFSRRGVLGMVKLIVEDLVEAEDTKALIDGL